MAEGMPCGKEGQLGLHMFRHPLDGAFIQKGLCSLKGFDFDLESPQ